MVDTSGYAAGNFLSGKELKEFPLEERWGIVLPGAEFRESDFQGRKSNRLYIPVSLSNKEEKDFNCNKTTAKQLREAWGDDTDAWVDKKIRFVLSDSMVKGTMRVIIYGEPFEKVKKEAAEAPAS